jgi:iron complex transport system substrate-binding protein
MVWPAMRRPEQQWESERFIARRAENNAGGQDEAGSQRFVLEPRAGGEAATAWFSLEKQVVDAAALAADPGLIFAVKAWLAARGGRRINLYTGEGEAVSAADFVVADLGDPLRGGSTRLITLCPSNAEMVAGLGCFARVIACETSSDWPPEVAKLERLGPDLGPDLERVAALGPDLVVSSLSVPGMERVVTGLRVRGIPQVVLAPRSVDEVLGEIRALGAMLGVEARARALCEEIEGERAALLAERPKVPARVYLEWWPRPMFSPAAQCYSNELIRLAGGVNVFGDRPGASVEVRPEELVAAAPDLCFVSWCGVALAKLDPENLIRRPGLEDLEAARRGRVFTLDERYSGRPGPRMLEAARIMAAAIRSLAGEA